MCVIPIGLKEKMWLIPGFPISGKTWLPFQLPAGEVTLPCEASPINQVKNHINLCLYPTFQSFVLFPILSHNISKSSVGNLSQMGKLWFSKIKWLAQGQITLDSLCPVTVRPVKEGRGTRIEIIDWGYADGEMKRYETCLQETSTRTSLVVQWLRLRVASAGGLGFNLWSGN